MVRGLRLISAIVLLCVFYASVAVGLTWPAAAHLDEIVMGGGELGGWLWRYFWHFLEVDALAATEMSFWERWTHLVALGRYPETGNILDVLFLSVPLADVFGFPAHYNLKILLILTVNGLCGFALARHFSRNSLAALAAGVIAIVNPLTIQEINGSGLRQALLWWVLLYPLMLDRAFRRRGVWDGLLAGVTFGLAAAWYWFYGLFAGIYSLMVLVAWVWRRELSVRTAIRWVASAAVAGGVIVSLFVLPYLGRGATDAGVALPEMSFFVPFPRYETLAEAPIRPDSYEDNVLASLRRTITSSWCADTLFRTTSDRAFPAAVLWLGILPAFFFRRGRFWASVVLLFYLFSLGPYLRLWTSADTSSVFLLGDAHVIKMPFAWLFQFVPGMARMFAPYRLASFAVVGSVVVVAIGIDIISRRFRRPRLVTALLALVVVSTTMLQVFYRFEIDDVPEDAFEPSRWKRPIKVSKMDVPDFYRQLDADALEGVIELPVGREQDVLAYYQVAHRQKVHRSWATPSAVPPWVQESGGGVAGERLRYLVEPLPPTFPGNDTLEQLSFDPSEVAPERLTSDALGPLIRRGKYRYLVVHERGYFLVNPQRGPVMYEDAVRRLSAALEIEPRQVLEHAWTDYPGNEYHVPDGPVYVPWSAEEIRLPDREMPKRLYMAIFDLSGILTASPLPDESDLGQTRSVAPVHSQGVQPPP